MIIRMKAKPVPGVYTANGSPALAVVYNGRQLGVDADGAGGVPSFIVPELEAAGYQRADHIGEPIDAEAALAVADQTELAFYLNVHGASLRGADGIFMSEEEMRIAATALYAEKTATP